jgi:alkylated DNA repair dioxygenase AlkB
MTNTTRTAEAGNPLAVTLTQHLADMLWHTGTTSAETLTENRDRFESDPVLPDPDDAIFAASYMRWCRTAADAVLLLAYEQAAGHSATMLWDLDEDEHVVLSTRLPAR